MIIGIFCLNEELEQESCSATPQNLIPIGRQAHLYESEVTSRFDNCVPLLLDLSRLHEQIVHWYRTVVETHIHSIIVDFFTCQETM